MALSLANQWPAVSAGLQDVEISITPTDGSWLVACVTWRIIDGSVPQFSVGDLRRNLWTLAKLVVNTAAGIGAQIWVCPNVETYGLGTKVYVAPSFIGSFDVGSLAIDVLEIAGVSGGLVFDAAVPGTASGTSSIALAAPTPAGSANCLQVAAAAVDVAYASYAATGTGWTQLGNSTNTNPDVGFVGAWREGTTGGTATFTIAGSHAWAGVVVSIQAVGALPSVSPDWGGQVAMEVQLALGYDQDTPLPAMRWLTLSNLCQGIHTDRGLSADLGSVEASPNTIDWINDAGQFTPRPGGSAWVIAAGTSSTAKISDVDAAGFVVGDFVRLETSAGALKEDTVFQITALPSSAGTTTVSFTPPAAASTAVGDQLIGVPVDIFTPVRALATVDAKTYPVMVGTSESLPQTWLDGTHGRVSMTAVDAYASLTPTIPDVIDGEILRGGPSHFWRLDDPSGAGQAANSIDSRAILVQKTSKFGAGTNGAADFGASTSDVQFGPAATQVDTLFGQSATGWGQTGLASGDTTKGFALVGSSDNFPPISGGVTFVGISCLFTSQPTGDGTVFIIRNRDPAGGGGAGSIIKLALDSSAQAAVTVWDKDTHVSTRTLLSSGAVIIGNSGWIPWAVTITRTSWTVYASGSFFSQSGSCDLVDRFTSLDFGGEADAAWNGHCVNGVHSRFAIYPRVLRPGEIEQLHQAVSLGMSQVSTVDGTIRRQLLRAGWPGARILPHSDIFTSEDNGYENQAVGQVVSDIATYEDGLLGVDAAGYLRLWTRDLLDRAVPKFVLGPNTGAGEIPYLGAPVYDADGQLLFTQIDVENTAKVGIGISGQTFADRSGVTSTLSPFAASKGARPRSWPVHLVRIGDVYNLGQWLAARYGIPRVRIRQVQVDPRAASGTAGWHAVLGAEFGDVVTVKWDPGGAPSLDDRCIVLGIKHDATPSRWITTFTLMVASDPGIVLDDTTAGVISSGTLTL